MLGLEPVALHRHDTRCDSMTDRLLQHAGYCYFVLHIWDLSLQCIYVHHVLLIIVLLCIFCNCYSMNSIGFHLSMSLLCI